MAVKPLTPAEALKNKVAVVIPDAVIEAANELLAKKYTGSSANITIDELCKLAREKLGNPNHKFGDGELDIEFPFRKAGWIVTFDRPGFNETYSGNWTFKKKGSR